MTAQRLAVAAYDSEDPSQAEGVLCAVAADDMGLHEYRPPPLRDLIRIACENLKRGPTLDRGTLRVGDQLHVLAPVLAASIPLHQQVVYVLRSSLLMDLLGHAATEVIVDSVGRCFWGRLPPKLAVLTTVDLAHVARVLLKPVLLTLIEHLQFGARCFAAWDYDHRDAAAQRWQRLVAGVVVAAAQMLTSERLQLLQEKRKRDQETDPLVALETLAKLWHDGFTFISQALRDTLTEQHGTQHLLGRRLTFAFTDS